MTATGLETNNHFVRKQTLNHLVWLNGWVFFYELSGCGFKSSCSHLNFKFRACFEQGVSWHSGKAIIKCGFTVKRVRDMTRTLSVRLRTKWLGVRVQSLWHFWLCKKVSSGILLNCETYRVRYVCKII